MRESSCYGSKAGQADEHVAERWRGDFASHLSAISTVLEGRIIQLGVRLDW